MSVQPGRMEFWLFWVLRDTNGRPVESFVRIAASNGTVGGEWSKEIFRAARVIGYIHIAPR